MPAFFRAHSITQVCNGTAENHGNQLMQSLLGKCAGEFIQLSTENGLLSFRHYLLKFSQQSQLARGKQGTIKYAAKSERSVLLLIKKF